MSYPISLARAARRHLEAANLLDHEAPKGKRDVAGYLYGIAAECALKEMMRASGMRREGPFYDHFPELKTSLRDTAEGRHCSRLRAYAEDDALMSEWSVTMRYSDGPSVLEKRIDRWAEQARRLVHAMEAL